MAIVYPHLIVFAILLINVAHALEPSVEVNGAIITGKNKISYYIDREGTVYEGKPVQEFLGIRYANEPDRFAKAELSEPQPGDHIDATKLPNSCPQVPFTNFNNGKFQGEAMWNPSTNQSEDCLFLNIWRFKPEESDVLKHVLVWIYGGGFISGTSTLDLYNGAKLSYSSNTVVVSMNYRVNVFGFLYFDNPNAPGNMGLWDQLLALQWVKKHIEAFGGDPDKITIFGESAGAASVNMHLLSSHSHSYFKSAIMQSASALAPWATRSREVMLKRSQVFARYMDCTGTDESIIACLRGKTMKQILDTQATDWFGYGGPNEWDFNDFGWVPVIDGDFLRDTPENLLKQLGRDFDKNVLVGVNRDEGIYFVVYANTTVFNSTQLYTREKTSFINSENFQPFFISLLPSVYKKNTLLRDAIFRFYVGEMYAPDSEANILTPSGQQQYQNKMQYALDRMVGDLHFVCPVNEFADMYSDRTSGNTYYYYFNHRSSVQTWPEWMGVLHGYEINFIFREPRRSTSELHQTYDGLYGDRHYDDDEDMLSGDMMSSLVHFIRGKPPTNSLVEWPRYNSSSRSFGVFRAGRRHFPLFGNNRRQPQCAFWRFVVNLSQRMMSACAIWRTCAKKNDKCKSDFVRHLSENSGEAVGEYNWVYSSIGQASFTKEILCPM